MSIQSKEYARKHYEANKRMYLDRNNRRRWEKRLWLIGYKDRPCLDCGLRFPYYVMDLDHRDPTQKLFEISQLANTGSWTVLKAEVAKCDVVCSNCHRFRTCKGQKLVDVPRSRGEMPALSQRGLDILHEIERISDGVEDVQA